MAKVLIREKILLCPICSNDEWHTTRVRIMGSMCLKDKFIQQERKIFECTECGHGMWFGVVEDYEKGTLNTKIIPTEYDKEFD